MDILLEVKYKEKKLKGILVKEDNDFIVLKLSSGYNANLAKKDLKIISKKEIKNGGGRAIFEQEDKGLPKIVVLHTGGTIASKIDYRTGAVCSQFSAEELLSLFLELLDKAFIIPKMVANIFSEDMRFEEYNLLLNEIDKVLKEEKDVAGIIISHGTDTLHYSSAALQYACDNLPIPVILVGAQRSSDRASSDAFSNLNAAVDFIISQNEEEKEFRRVGICMHESIGDECFCVFDGIGARKMHSTRRDAFKQINYLPFARIQKGKVDILREDLLSLKPKKGFSFTKFDTKLRLGFLKAHPNMFADEILYLKSFDGVVLEGTGVGNIPEHEDNSKKDGRLLRALSEVCKKTNVIAGVQTVFGEVSLDIYSRGRDIQKCGVLGNRMNLPTETLLVRLAYVLSKKKGKIVSRDWERNLEGFSCRNIDEGFLD